MSNASDFIIENGVLTKYVGPGGDVVVPEGVTDIGKKAFYGCKELTSIVIPDGVTAIGNEAFLWCPNLTKIEIADSVTSIGNEAFWNCRSLADLVIPAGVTFLGSAAFGNCTSLNNVVLSGGITTISPRAFKGCSSLISLEIPEGVTVIKEEAFADCRNLESVTFPSSVSCICVDAFKFCCRLANVDFSEGLETIKYAAFADCKLSRIAIPASVKKIDTAAFGFAEFMDAVPIEIADIGALPSVLRPWAAICFAEDGGLNTDPRFPGHTKYIKANAAKLVEQAMKHPALLELMCREKLIAPKNVEAYLAAVQKTKSPELIAMMLDYQANKVTAKQKNQVAKAKERQEDTVFDRIVARQGKVGIDGLNFVVSGDLETFENRKELKAFLESQGAKLLSSLSAKTDYLIMNKNQVDGEKKKRATELQVEIITEEEFNDKAGRKFIIDEEGTLMAYIGRDVDVTIPDTVKSFYFDAFEWNVNLRSVAIPNTVEVVDLRAFYGCSNLISISATEYTRFFGVPGVFCKKVTIHAPAGSYAETYAKENNIPFVAE